MKDVLKHPLGRLPWALANCDGTLKKTNKASLARQLEKMSAPADSIPAPSMTVIDGTSLMHKINGENRTFAELSQHILTSALQEGADSVRIDIVFDTYTYNLAIKTIER